jgi:ribosomal protein S18 acetylase RimI-like enzyme
MTRSAVKILELSRTHLAGIVALCRQEGWPSYGTDPRRTWRALNAPGVTSVVAIDDETVVGFAYLQSDGEIQAHLSLIAVDRGRRREGIGQRLIEVAFARSGADRIDLISEADAFYESFAHKRQRGYRIYPGNLPKQLPKASRRRRRRPLSRR